MWIDESVRGWFGWVRSRAFALVEGADSIYCAIQALRFKRAGKLSWYRLTRCGKELPSYQGGTFPSTGALSYSRQSFEIFKPLSRVKWPIHALLAFPDFDAKSSRLLIVGPRFESEFYIARNGGFRRKNIVMIDLLPLGKKIIFADMHETGFENGVFDCIACGWTLSYSKEPERAVRELARIIRPGGLISFGVEIHSRQSSNPDADTLQGKQRIQSRQDFRKLCSDLEIVSYTSSGVGGNAVCLMRKKLNI